MLLVTRAHIRVLFTLILIGLAALRSQPVGAQEEGDVCLPDEFFAVNATYFPFETDVALSNQWFSLEAERERVDTFLNDTDFVGFIDAYDLGVRHVLLGTHEDRQILSIDSCFLAELPDPVQDPICFAEGTSRQGSLSLGYAPLQNRTLENTADGQPLTQIDVLSAEIGSVSVPVRIVERVPGRAFLLLELWNLRLEVDTAALEIPAACDGAPPPGSSSTSSAAAQLREWLSEHSWDLLRGMPTTRRLLGAADR